MKKLHLHRETLRHLLTADLRHAEGGALPPHTTLCTRALNCSDNPTCPPSICVVC